MVFHLHMYTFAKNIQTIKITHVNHADEHKQPCFKPHMDTALQYLKPREIFHSLLFKKERNNKQYFSNRIFLM